MMKVHPIRHVIIWIVIAIVLFPVLWIFTTSIRRDNAYISSSLFSSQTTWQNYIDLIVEPKNVPALYNEISNIYSLGDPYDKMSKKEVLGKLNSDFEAYQNYFNKTLKMSSSIYEDAKWINTNVLPQAKSIALDNVKKYGKQDVEYLSSLASYLSKRYSSLDKEYKLAGMYKLLQQLQNSPDEQALKVVSVYFPQLQKGWEKYRDSSRKAAEKIKNVPSTVSKLLEKDNVKGQSAQDLIDAYQETYDMMKSGTFSYAKWFAPIYLRKINMDTIKLSQKMKTPEKDELLKIKSEVFSLVQGLRNSKASYDKALSDALSTTKNAYTALIGKLQASLDELSSSYSEKMSALDSLKNEIDKNSLTLTKDASQIGLFSTNIVPTSMALSEFVSVVKSVLNSSQTQQGTGNGTFYDFSSYIDLTQKWLGYVPKTKEFSEVKKKVENILKALEFLQSKNAFLLANANLDAISNIKSSLPFVMIKLQAALKMSLPVLQNYSSTQAQISQDYAKFQKINQETNSLSQQMASLRKKVNAINTKILISQLYYSTMIFNEKAKKTFNSINSFESAQTFLNDLSDFYARVENTGLSVPAIPSYSRYEEFFNVKKLMETSSLAIETSKAINQLVSQYSSYINDLKKRSASYVEVNMLGFPLMVKELSSMSSLYHGMYVSKIGPALGIISRRSHDLSTLTYLSKAKGKLNDMNDSAYYLTQYWKVKYVPPFMRWLLNSIIVAGTAAIITVFLSAFMAYPFSRFRFVGRKYGLIGLLLVQMFPTMMAMVALYLLLNFIGKFFPPLGLNTLGGLTFLYIGGGIAFNAWLIKGFFDAIPKELEEAAMVDGATRFQTFWRVVLPLSTPVLAVTTILGFVGNYGDYILASIVLTGIKHYTYAVGLQTFSTSQYSTNWGLLTAAALIGMIPILAIFLGLQRFIVGGLTQGSVKG